MTHYPLFDHGDPGMRYEGLARYAFDCDRWGGPDGIAHQSRYNYFFIPDVTEEGLETLHLILDALIEKEDENKSEFEGLKESLSEGMEQMTAIHLINLLIDIIKED